MACGRDRKAKDILGETAISSPRSSSEPPNFPKATDVEDALWLQKHLDNSSQTKGVRKALEYGEDSNSNSDSDESRTSIREGQPVRLKQNIVTVNQPPSSDTALLTQERISAPVPGSASSPSGSLFRDDIACNSTGTTYDRWEDVQYESIGSMFGVYARGTRYGFRGRA